MSRTRKKMNKQKRQQRLTSLVHFLLGLFLIIIPVAGIFLYGLGVAFPVPVLGMYAAITYIVCGILFIIFARKELFGFGKAGWSINRRVFRSPDNYLCLTPANRLVFFRFVCTFLFNKNLSPHTKNEVNDMAKQGMKRFYPPHDKNEENPVPLISGKAKSGKIKARPMIAGGNGKVFHTTPPVSAEKIPSAYGPSDNDLAVENLENDFDMTAADRQDLWER